MEWYIQLTIYFITTALALMLVFQIDFNKFMRIGKKQFAVAVWVFISLALGYLVGSLFVVIGEQLANV